MPKRRSDERGGGQPKPMRRHLYLVVDDWSSGYTIRKIDLLLDPVANYTSRQIITGGFLGKQRLPPPIMRVEAAPRGSPTHWVAAGESKLVFMPPIDDDDDPSTKPTTLPSSFVPVVDVRMRSTSLRPRPTDGPSVDSIYMPVGGAGGDGDYCLFALDSRGDAFSVLCPAPLDPEEGWSWRALPDPPFERRHVVSYAALPDGGLIVSTKAADDDDDDSEACFAFAMAGAEGTPPEWNRHHHSMFMPFAGRVHFDPALDAFVGLSGAPGSVGHLCLVYMDGSRKLSKEKLFGEGSAVERPQVKVFGEGSTVETQVGCTLVYMGGRSNFCLVQCICHGETNGGNLDSVFGDETMDGDGKLDDDQDVARHSCCLFRLTAFHLRYDKNGDVGIVILKVLYFSVPEGVTSVFLKNPAAFWM